jgi:hypothetical protein
LSKCIYTLLNATTCMFQERMKVLLHADILSFDHFEIFDWNIINALQCFNIFIVVIRFVVNRYRDVVHFRKFDKAFQNISAVKIKSVNVSLFQIQCTFVGFHLSENCSFYKIEKKKKECQVKHVYRFLISLWTNTVFLKLKIQ